MEDRLAAIRELRELGATRVVIRADAIEVEFPPAQEQATFERPNAQSEADYARDYASMAVASAE